MQHVERLQAQLNFVRVTESMALRNLIELGLGVAESPAGAGGELLLLLEPEPVSTGQVASTPSPLAHTLSAVERILQAVQQSETAEPVQTPLTQTRQAADTAVEAAQLQERRSEVSRIPLPARNALTATKRKIRHLREQSQYSRMSLGEFAQELFEKDIYRAKSKTGKEVPMNRRTLDRWLKGED